MRKKTIKELCEEFLDELTKPDTDLTGITDFAKFYMSKDGKPAPPIAWRALRDVCEWHNIFYEHPVKIIEFLGKRPIFCCGEVTFEVNGKRFNFRAHAFNRGKNGFSRDPWPWRLSSGSRKTPATWPPEYKGAIEEAMIEKYGYGRCCQGCIPKNEKD